MRYDVQVSRGAENDLAEIVMYFILAESHQHAARFVKDLGTLVSKLEQFPRRGAVPKEIDDLGNSDFRQVLLGDYRVIYEVSGKTVRVLIVVDGKRDLSSILQKRLLSS